MSSMSFPARLLRRSILSIVVVAFGMVLLASESEARRSGRDPVQPGKNNCRLDKGSIKMPGWPVFDAAGVQVATKRVTILWRYVDANCDGQMTWGVGPAEGADYLRIVPRTTSLRAVRHDDLIPWLPAPGDFVVTQGTDGLPIPGLSLSVHMFTDSGDVTAVPGVAPIWGARFVLSVDPLLSNGSTPAGAFIFVDSQLNVYDVVPDASGNCEFGFAEEDWINANGGGAIQLGPNTAAPANIDVVPVPILFAPQCLNGQ